MDSGDVTTGQLTTETTGSNNNNNGLFSGFHLIIIFSVIGGVLISYKLCFFYIAEKRKNSSRLNCLVS